MKSALGSSRRNFWPAARQKAQDLAASYHRVLTWDTPGGDEKSMRFRRCILHVGPRIRRLFEINMFVRAHAIPESDNNSRLPDADCYRFFRERSPGRSRTAGGSEGRQLIRLPSYCRPTADLWFADLLLMQGRSGWRSADRQVFKSFDSNQSF